MALFTSSRPGIRGRVLVKFPAQVLGGTGLSVVKDNGIYTFALNIDELGETTSVATGDMDNLFGAFFDDRDDSYTKISLTKIYDRFTADFGGAFQPLHANLTAFAGLTLIADRLPYANGTGTLALATFTGTGRALVGAASVAAAQQSIDVEVGVDVQAFNALLAAISAISSSGFINRIGAGSVLIRTFAAGTGLSVADGDGLNGNPTYSISDVELLAIAGLTSAADRLPYFTGSGTASLATFTAFGRSLVDDADATAGRVTLGTVIGTNVQAFSALLDAIAAINSSGFINRIGAGTVVIRTMAAGTGLGVVDGDGLNGNPTYSISDVELLAIAGLTSAADRVPYFTGSGTAALATFTSYGRSIAAVANEAAFKALVNLEIGTDVPAFVATDTSGSLTSPLPAITFGTPGDLSVAYSTQDGTWTRRDDRVQVTINLVTSTFTHTTASGNLTITGLPFTSAASSFVGTAQWTGINKTGGFTQIVARIEASTTSMIFLACGMGVTAATVVAADVPTGGPITLRINITYRV